MFLAKLRWSFPGYLKARNQQQCNVLFIYTYKKPPINLVAIEQRLNTYDYVTKSKNS